VWLTASVVEDYAAVLADLRHHYGAAYAVSHPAPDVWTAQRRDTREMLRAADPETLRGLIRDDCARNPVPR
jgi:hypothetical protein